MYTNRWSPKELEYMREFINAFPEEVLRTTSIHPLLEGKFPGRSVGAIYHGWRRCKGLKRKKRINAPSSTTHIPKQVLSPNLVDSISRFIQAHIDAEVEKKIANIKKKFKEMELAFKL